MDFDPKKYLAEKTGGGEFDPKKYLSEKTGEKPSSLESVGEGLEHGATLGFNDELSGGYRKLMSKLAGRSDEEAAAAGTKARDASRAEQAAAKEANPTAYGAADVGGGALPQVGAALLTGGTSIPAQIGLGAAGAATQSLGDAPELNAQALKNAGEAGLVGGALGGAGAAGGKLIGKGIGALGRNIVDRADAASAGALGSDLEGALGKTDWLGDVKPGEAAASGMPAEQAAAFEQSLKPAESPAPKSVFAHAFESAKARSGTLLKNVGLSLLAGQPHLAGAAVAKEVGGVAKDVGKKLLSSPEAKAAMFQAAGKVGTALAKTPEHLGPYAASIARAAAQGPGALNVMHFIRGQSDPAYQEMVSKLSDQD